MVDAKMRLAEKMQFSSNMAQKLSADVHCTSTRDVEAAEVLPLGGWESYYNKISFERTRLKRKSRYIANYCRSHHFPLYFFEKLASNDLQYNENRSPAKKKMIIYNWFSPS